MAMTLVGLMLVTVHTPAEEKNSVTLVKDVAVTGLWRVDRIEIQTIEPRD